jgi:hypothetical protein
MALLAVVVDRKAPGKDLIPYIEGQQEPKGYTGKGKLTIGQPQKTKKGKHTPPCSSMVIVFIVSL